MSHSGDFCKGNIPWNKGKKEIYSKETIEKMRESAFNRPPREKLDIEEKKRREREQCKKYYATNKEKCQALNKLWREKNKDRLKEGREKYKEIMKTWNSTQPIYKREASKKYRLKYGRENMNLISKRYRHKHGISKKYISDLGISRTKEYKKLQRHKRRLLNKNAGELSVKIIQLIYQDNIKKYGTLTCYLCLKPVEFGKDHLEHKTPLSRGGTNNYDNLEISCQECNCRKHTKTEKEYREKVNATCLSIIS